MKLTQALVLFGLAALLIFQMERSSAEALPEKAEIFETDTGDVIFYKSVGQARLELELEECERNLKMELPKVGHVSGMDSFHLWLKLGEIRHAAERLCKSISGSFLQRAVKVYMKASKASYKEEGHTEWKPEVPPACRG